MKLKLRIPLPGRALQNVGLAAFVATASVLFWPPERHYIPILTPLYSLERLGYDALFTLRGAKPERMDPSIDVVGFDRESERDLKVRWPPERKYHAAVIRNLAKDGAKMIVYDVLFSDGTDPANDRELDAALKEAGNVVLPLRIDRDFAQKRKSLEEPHYDDAIGVDFLANARVGFAEVPTEEDDVVRRMVPLQPFRDQYIPSLSAAAYLKLTGKEETDVALTTESIRIGDLLIPRNGPTTRDVADGGLIPSAYMDFPMGNATFVLDTRFSQVALGTFPKGKYKDKIVFVGLVGPELTKQTGDQYVTAYSNFSTEQFGSLAFKRLPGVYLQAQTFNALLTQGFVTRLPEWATWVICFGITLGGAVSVRRYFNWRGPVFLLLAVLLYVSYAIIAFGTFRIHLPWVVPSLLMLSSVSLVAYIERGALKRKWSGYVSPQVLETILRSEGETTAQRSIATVVFGDIRGFTAFTNRHSPETVVNLLNQHFERMTSIIYGQNGTIDKFLGDGVMALFGVPVPRKDSVECAVRAGWQMCQVSNVPLELGGESYVFESGFGITTGPLVAGHVGSRTRHDYTVIGDAVNMAARLQGVTGLGDVIIDAATYSLVRSIVKVENLGKVAVKGASLPIECYRVLAVEGEAGELESRSEPSPAAATEA